MLSGVDSVGVEVESPLSVAPGLSVPSVSDGVVVVLSDEVGVLVVGLEVDGVDEVEVSELVSSFSTSSGV